MQCKQCGVEFEAKRSTAQYCSNRCKWQYARRTDPKEVLSVAQEVSVAPLSVAQEFSVAQPLPAPEIVYIGGTAYQKAIVVDGVVGFNVGGEFRSGAELYREMF